MLTTVTKTLERQNLVENPRPTSATYWQASSTVGTVTFTTTPTGKLACRSTLADVSNYAVYAGIKETTPRPQVSSAVAGDTYTLIYKLRGTVSQVAMNIGYGVASSAQVAGVETYHTLPSGQAELSVVRTFTVPAGAWEGQPLFLKPYVYGDPGNVGLWFEIYEVAWIEGDYSGPYFDGYSLDTAFTEFKFVGAENNSVSQQLSISYDYTIEATSYNEDQLRAKFSEPQVKVTRRVEILESDGKTLWEGAGSDSRLIGGNVSVDYTRDERRSLDCQLANFDNTLIHQPGGFWYDKIVRVYRGISFRDKFGTHEYEISLGKFMIDRVSQPRFPNVVNITARDYTKKCMMSKFTTNTGFSAGTSIKTIIEALAANSGVFDRILPSSVPEVLAQDTVFERGATRWEAMKQLASAFAYELFFDAQGYLVMRKFLDPTTSPISHEFATGASVGNLVDWEKSTNDTRIFNVVSVGGISAAQVPIRAEARNTNSASPTSVAKIGERVLPFDSDFISTQTQAQELADSLLRVNGLEEYTINMTSLVAPWLEAGEIVRFVDPDAADNDPDRFLLTSFSIPLGLGGMSAVGRRVTIVS